MRANIIEKLSAVKGRLSPYGVTKLGLFGSACRDDWNEASDIDILLDFQQNQETYLNFLSSCELLEEEFEGFKLDIVTLKGLSPFIGKYIEKEVVYV